MILVTGAGRYRSGGGAGDLPASRPWRLRPMTRGGRPMAPGDPGPERAGLRTGRA